MTPRTPAIPRPRGATPRRAIRSKLPPMAPGLRMIGLGLALAGCTAASEEVRPPASGLFFPTGISVSPSEEYLFVNNANSELRYDSGSVSVLDLGEIDRVADGWIASATIPPGCHQDTDHRETLVCNEDPDSDDDLPAPPFILAEKGVRVGNFASAMAVQDRTGGQLRLWLGVRGDPSITYVDWDGQRLGCGGDTVFPLCDEEHRLTAIHGDPDFGTIADEPFQIFVDSVLQFAVVTHLTTGTVTLVDTPLDRPPVLADVLTGLFQADANNARGAAAVAGRTPQGPGDDIVYVTSRTEDRVQMLTVARDAISAFFVPSNYFFLDVAGGNTGGSSDTRYAAFVDGGDRLLLVNRAPPSLQVYDTSLDETGFPSNTPIAAGDVCIAASNMAVVDVGDGERAYISCHSDGEVYVMDPSPTPQVDAIVSVGRGPFGVAASATRQKLYVTNFLEDTIAVVELAPDSPRRYQVVLRIGEPR